MIVRLGLTNGRIVQSRDVPDQEIQDHIDALDGRIGSDHFADVRVENVADALAFIDRLWSVALADQENGKFLIDEGEGFVTYPSRDVAWVRFA